MTLATVVGAFGASPAFASAGGLPEAAANELVVGAHGGAAAGGDMGAAEGGAGAASKNDFATYITADAAGGSAPLAVASIEIVADGAAFGVQSSGAVANAGDSEPSPVDVGASDAPASDSDASGAPSSEAASSLDSNATLGDPSLVVAGAVSQVGVEALGAANLTPSDADFDAGLQADAQSDDGAEVSTFASNVRVSSEQELLAAIAAIPRNESATITLASDIVLTQSIAIDLPINVTINMGSHTLRSSSSQSLFRVAGSVDVVEASLYGGASSCLDITSAAGLFSKSSGCNFLFEFRGGLLECGSLGASLDNASVKIAGGKMVASGTVNVGSDALFELDSSASLTSTAVGCAVDVGSGGYFNMNGGSLTYAGAGGGAGGSGGGSAIRCDSGGVFHIYNSASMNVDGVSALYCEKGSTLDFGKCYIVSKDGTIATGTVSGPSVKIDGDSRPEFSDTSVREWLDANGYALITADESVYYGVTKAVAEAESVGELNGIYYTDQAYYDSIKGAGPVDPPDPGPGPDEPDPGPGPDEPDPPTPPDPGPNEPGPVGPVDPGAGGSSAGGNGGSGGSGTPTPPNPSGSVGPGAGGSGAGVNGGGAGTGGGSAWGGYGAVASAPGSRGPLEPHAPETPWNPPGLALAAGFTVPASGPGVLVRELMSAPGGTPAAGAGAGGGAAGGRDAASPWDALGAGARTFFDAQGPAGVDLPLSAAEVAVLVGLGAATALAALIASRRSAFLAANAAASTATSAPR